MTAALPEMPENMDISAIMGAEDPLFAMLDNFTNDQLFEFCDKAEAILCSRGVLKLDD